MPELLTPKQVAKAIGVSESSLKRWCDRGAIPFTLTPGGHRKILVGNVVEFLRTKHQPLVAPEAIGLPINVGRGSVSLENAPDALYHALIDGKREQAVQIILDLYLASHRVSQIGDVVLGPVFRRIGDSWECGKIDVYHERRSCEIAVRMLHELHNIVIQPTEQAPRAMGATPDRDYATIGTLLAELVLREMGWNASSLGSGLPFESLLKAVHDQRPRLVWLSVSHVAQADEFLAAYESFYSRIPPGTAVVVGGKGLDEELRQRMRYSAHGDTLQRLEDFARTLHPIPGSASNRTTEASS